MSLSIFNINYTKVNLLNDVSTDINRLISKVNQGDISKSNTNLMWFEENILSLLLDYDMYKPNINILEDEEYQNLLNALKQMLNKYYYGYK